MTAQGVGHACRINGKMDAALYTHILDDEFLETLEYYELGRDEIIFQQDNDPKHTSRTNGSRTRVSRCWTGPRSHQI